MLRSFSRFFRSRTTVIACGFALLILGGTLLLMLPASAREGRVTFREALFTATSASCVTGLIVQDTFRFWSRFGQVVLLVLMQMGGLGVMTVATLMLLLAHRRIGVRQRELLSESLNAPHSGGILGLLRTVVGVTLVCEGLGTALLCLRFVPELGLGEGVFTALFLAVSAFCNAGFDLCGRWEAFSSLTRYAADPLVSLTVCALIAVGGLGFLVWRDILRFRLRFSRYSLHSRIVLLMTGVLLAGGTIGFFILERNATGAAFGWGGRLLTALFSATTARTAGFNSVEMAALSPAGKLLTMCLMFIGGSPGSTAGGVKTTTVFVLLAYAFSQIRVRRSAGVLGRRLEEDALKKSVAVTMLSLMAVLGASFVLLALEDVSLTDALFECFSAVGTAGMSTGITRALGPVSQMTLVLCMYLGRLGSLTFAMALGEHGTKTEVRMPEEKIVIG